MNTVYSVSSGSYSDYEVLCLFTTRELAQQYINEVKENLRKADLRHLVNDYYIEDFQLFETVPVAGRYGKPAVEES